MNIKMSHNFLLLSPNLGLDRPSLAKPASVPARAWAQPGPWPRPSVPQATKIRAPGPKALGPGGRASGRPFAWTEEHRFLE